MLPARERGLGLSGEPSVESGVGRGGSGLGPCSGNSLVGLGGVGVGTRLRTSCFGGLGVLERRMREGKRGCVSVSFLGGESDIKDGAVTAR